MECKRCKNKDPAYFYLGAKGYYCRKCIRFSRILLQEELQEIDYEVASEVDEYHFNYPLTDPQKKASLLTKQYCINNDVLLHCVCGAGKTEIVVESISYYLSMGKKVAYSIARKEVVIELTSRFKDIFPRANVVGVYGGHHKEIYGDLIVCTTHQLYRYYNSFDLLVIDEVDAYPLKGNETLFNIALNSCKGQIIFSTATIDDSLKKILDKRVYKVVELNVRPSFKPLAIPKIIYLPKLLMIIYLYILLKSFTNQTIIFVSTKKQCRYLYYLFSKLFSCTYVYSDLDKRNDNILAFKEKKYQNIISTTVLERGITIKNINVVILDIGNIFDQSSLIQMLGRIGRGINNNEGEGYILSNKYSKKLNNTIEYLKKANSYL